MAPDERAIDDAFVVSPPRCFGIVSSRLLVLVAASRPDAHVSFPAVCYRGWSAMIARSSTQFVRNDELDADDTAQRYFAWVDGSLPGVQAHTSMDGVAVGVFGLGDAIVLSRREHTAAAASYEVVGGFLAAADPAGEFRFERVPGGLQISLTAFKPRLPLVPYYLLHATLHALVMFAFCRTIARGRLP